MTKLKPEFELAKRLKGPSQMDRVHAARAMLHSTMGSETMALRAFMDIFHPEVSQDRVRELVNDLKAQGKR
jgi:hypothetical protein